MRRESNQVSIRILWIEDNAAQDLAYWAAPVYMAGGYDLVVAPTASEGAGRILESEFDAVIVDIRLPPGPEREWIEVYNSAARMAREPQLGLELLYSVLGHRKAKVPMKARPNWVTAERFGVLTVERAYQEEVTACLQDLGLKVFVEKTTETPETILLDLVDQIKKVVR
jgi:CheY-like chemotaxis protein